MAGTGSPSLVDGELEADRGAAIFDTNGLMPAFAGIAYDDDDDYDDDYDVVFDTYVYSKSSPGGGGANSKVHKLGISPLSAGSGNGASSLTRWSFGEMSPMFLFLITIYFRLVL